MGMLRTLMYNSAKLDFMRAKGIQDYDIGTALFYDLSEDEQRPYLRTAAKREGENPDDWFPEKEKPQ